VKAVEAIATTAHDVLSGSPQTVQKKTQMWGQIDDLKELARFVRDYNLQTVMGDSFHGLYGDLYQRLDGSGKIKRKQVTVMGLELAQKLAKDKLQVLWKGFQAEVWATTYKGLNLGAVSVENRNNIQKAMNDLSQTYFKLAQAKPSDGERDFGGKGYFNELLSSDLYLNDNEYGERFIMEGFEQLFVGQKSPDRAIAAIKMTDRLLQASRRVVDLNAKWSWYNGITGDSFLNYYGTVPNDLLKLGFEIARSNPTVTTGENPMSEWIETLVETTDPTAWKNKGMRSVAGGLSEWFDGFDLGPLLMDLSSDGYNGRWQMPEKLGKAIEYAGRLVMAARAIDDGNLVGEVKKADFLSHLVNLGGAYASTQLVDSVLDSNITVPNTGLFEENINFFADVLWKAKSEGDMLRGSRELSEYFNLFDSGKNTHTNRISSLKLQTEILQVADRPSRWSKLSEPFLLAPLFVQDGYAKVSESFSIPYLPTAQSNAGATSGLYPWIPRYTEEQIDRLRDGANANGSNVGGIDSTIRAIKYPEEQRLEALSLIKTHAKHIEAVARKNFVSSEAIAGVILWEALENPYPLLRADAGKIIPSFVPVNTVGIAGKVHVNLTLKQWLAGEKKTVSQKVEDEGYIEYKYNSWQARAKSLKDPKIAIEYIGAIMNRAAKIYEQAADTARELDRQQTVSDRPTFNIREQAGILGALYQGGQEESRAKAFEARRTAETRFLERLEDMLRNPMITDPFDLTREIAKVTPLLDSSEKMGPWVSQYRWYIRSELAGGGASAFYIGVLDSYAMMNKPLHVRLDIVGLPSLYIMEEPAGIPVSEYLRNEYESSKKR
jgi:hypothetical protein